MSDLNTDELYFEIGRLSRENDDLRERLDLILSHMYECSTMLDLNTQHVPPENKRCWGECRHVAHEHGWILFINPAMLNDGDVPLWLVPLYTKAVKNNCVLINFDQDADIDDDLPTWVW